MIQDFSSSLRTPWKITIEIRRMFTIPYTFLYLVGNGVGMGARCRIYGRPIIQRHKQSTINLGNSVILRSMTASNPLAPNHPVLISTRQAGASISIGDDVGITGGTICADNAIDIGDRVFIGANCIIVDTDYHPLDPVDRQQRPFDGQSAPVFIGDDVFIGMNSIILKGVSIGKGSVIGAGSVVTSDVSEGVIVAGNPARLIRTL